MRCHKLLIFNVETDLSTIVQPQTEEQKLITSVICKEVQQL